jgi:hypothetical protein
MTTSLLDTPALDEKVTELRETLPEFDFERASRYSLADAIREGSSVTEQKVGGWVGEDSSVCALSAGLLAVKARHML